MITSTLKYWIGLKVPLVLKLKNLKLLTVFAWSKKHVVLCYPDGRLCIFCWLIPDTFPWLLLSVGLIRRSTYWNCLVFQKELITDDSLPFHLWIVTALWCVGGGLFSLPHSLFCSTLLNGTHFSLPFQFVLKLEHLHYV